MAEITRAPGIASHYFHVSNELARNPNLTPRAARVYLFISSHNDGWKVTSERVAKSIGLSEGTVKSALRDLIDLGYVESTQVKDEKGRIAGVNYTVFETSQLPTVQILNHGESAGQAQGSKNPPVEKTHQWKKPTSGEFDPYKKTNSFKNTIPNKKTNTPNEFGARFDEFWKLYPRKAGKTNAAKKYLEALEVTDDETLLTCVRNFAQHHERAETEKRYIPYPATFLGQERWRDFVTAPSPRRTGREKLQDLERWMSEI